jgi:hypothetical protein
LSLGGRSPANISKYEKFLLKTYFPAQSKRIDKAKAKNKADADPGATPSHAKKNQTTQPNNSEESDEGTVRVSQQKHKPQQLQPPLPTMPTIQAIQWMIKLRILIVTVGGLLMKM